MILPAATVIGLFVLLLGLAATVTISDSDDAVVSGRAVISFQPVSGPPTTDAGMSGATSRAQIGRVTNAIQPSLVVLQGSWAGQHVVGTGVAIEAGGILVTTDRQLAGGRALDAILADGTHLPATFVATDRETGVTVFQVQRDLPIATLAAGPARPGAMVMTVALRPQPNGTLRPVVAEGPVGEGILASTTSIPTTGVTTVTLATTAIHAPTSEQGLGCPVMDASGAVVGMLTSSSSQTAAFLPSRLVLGVATQLVRSGGVDHGALGATVGTGGVVTAVTPGSPAARAGLHVGDTLQRIDGMAVTSVSTLATATYADPPGTTVALVFLDQGAQQTASVVLDATP